MGIDIRTIVTVTCEGCGCGESAEPGELISGDWATVSFGILRHGTAERPYADIPNAPPRAVFCPSCLERVDALLGKMLADARARSAVDQSTHRVHPVDSRWTLCDFAIEAPGLRTIALAMAGTSPTCQDCSDILDRVAPAVG